MKPIFTNSTLSFVVALLAIAIISCTQTAKQEPQEAPHAGLFPKGEMVEKSHFSSGQAWVHWIMPSDSIYTTQLASVTYDKGSRTRWHYHPAGQILIITSGIAYYQEKGKPKQILSKGDVAKCPPGIHHWHGSSPDGPVTLMAINPNMDLGGVQWLEATTDEEYNH